jgi:hypothetical protein
MSEELWYVKLPNGDVHRVSLDQLDSAFQAGHIDESTMVLAAGASTWTKLGDLAGLDEQPEQPAEAAPAYASESIRQSEAAAGYVPQIQAPAYVPQAQAPAYAAHTQTLAYVPQLKAPSYVPQSQAAPVSSAYPSPAVAYAVPAQAPRAVASFAPVPVVANSLRPMSFDLGDDLDMPLPPSRKGRFVAAIVGLAAIAGGIGFAAQRINLPSGGSDIASMAAAAAIAPPPATPEPLPAPASEPVVAPPAAAPIANAALPAAAAGGSPLNPQFTTRFNEDTKAKLVAADKTHEAKAKTRHGAGHAAPRSKSNSTFTTGGNKFDPLNSSI